MAVAGSNVGVFSGVAGTSIGVLVGTPTADVGDIWIGCAVLGVRAEP
jgi:hypothetical protein